MAQTTSGKVLREAREKKGYDLPTVARRLRIRPDILRAIEAGDFAAMPPRGYTRNMVNAYARLLGLNPTEIVNMYLDEAYENQNRRSRGASSTSSFNMQRESRRSRSQAHNYDDWSRAQDLSRSVSRREEGSYRTRDLYDDRTRYSRDDYGITRERTERPGRSERDFMSHHSGYSSTNVSFLDEREPRRGGRSIHVGQTPMEFTASRLPSFLQSRTALIIAGVVVVLILAIILFAIFGHGKAEPEDDVSQLPVSGINDTTETEEESTSSVEIAPTSSRVVYSVDKGKECYVEIHEGENMTPEMLTGPVERNVEVTGSWIITTWSPETLKLTVDGTEVSLAPDENYGGMYSYTVDFNAILEEWRKTHTTRGEQRSAAAASASSASSSSSSAASTTGQQTSSSQQSGQTATGTSSSGSAAAIDTGYDPAYDTSANALYEESVGANGANGDNAAYNNNGTATY